MATATQIGMNRTGVKTAPGEIEEMLEAVERSRPSPGDETEFAKLRASFIEEADPVGTVPPPATLKGVAKAGMEKLAGERPEVLIDKLGERMAFERGGTRLYDSLIIKYKAMREQAPFVSLEVLEQFREAEARHFALCANALEYMGADPTAQTPCADVIGVEAAGLMQVMDDPRTTLPQCLNAILVAELADNAGWELLIKLAEEADQEDMAENFRSALTEERRHLEQIKTWHEQSVLDEAT